LYSKRGTLQSKLAARSPSFSCGYVANAQHMQQSEAFGTRRSGQRMRVATADAKLTWNRHEQRLFMPLQA